MNFLPGYKTLTSEEVTKFFILTRRELPDKEAQDYWTGRELKDLPDTMIKDDAMLLEQKGGVDL